MSANPSRVTKSAAPSAAPAPCMQWATVICFSRGLLPNCPPSNCASSSATPLRSRRAFSNSIAVLHIGCGYHYQQHQTQRIHQQVTLAPAQFLGPIIAPRASLFTASHRLAVQDRAAGLSFPSGRLSYPLAHGVMDLLPDPLAAPGPEVMIDGTPRWQIMRQQFPGGAAANRVADSI